MYDRWFTIALLAVEFGQVWAELGLRKSHTIVEIVGLHNCAVADKGFGQVWTKLGLRKSHATSGETLGLQNCAVEDKRSIDDGQYGD